MSHSQLIVVSARLPVSVKREGEAWTVEPSPGGLATALRTVAAERDFVWVGWPGTQVPPAAQTEVRRRLGPGRIPVFLDSTDYAGFYELFSNRLLWPLFHGMPDRVTYDRSAWHRYQAVNERFAAAALERARPGDLIWVHDYQLALVPKLLRSRGFSGPIGFFLHIPFPSSETYRTLPVREAVLEGMLGADLIGFHTYEYVSHFRNACLRVLGIESDPDTIHLPTHVAELAVLPIGIDPEEIRHLAESPPAQRAYRRLLDAHRGKTLIVGVDRLDYTKGIPQKLLAFEELLRRRPELCEKVVLIQVASPSRTGVAEYQALKCEVDELVGRINGAFGSTDCTPVVYINRNLSREELSALYRAAEVALVTPLRDGMNLVSLEYVAARGREPGTLVLSEFAGAAACLAGARLVNPHNPERVAEVLAEVLSAPPSPSSFEHMVDFVESNTASRWAERFLDRLEEVYQRWHEKIQRLEIDALDPADLSCRPYPPLVLLDYDGTLRPHTTVPAEAAPTPRVRTLLTELARYATVYVVSGRPASILDAWLGDLPIGLVCEHGLNVRAPGACWPPVRSVDRTVLEEIVRPIFVDFCERTPGSSIEDKKASIVWHYRAADPELGAWRAKELYALLEERLRGEDFFVLAGSRVIEVRHRDMSKGHVVAQLLDDLPEGTLVFCAGDDRTDEEMFEALLRSGHRPAIVCHVGGRNTVAPYYVESPEALLDALERLLARWKQEAGAASGARA
ncbi:MAG: bifunctional alpha,alpha-trehalose-phosphate synthase (UDP-forming)/trehalose-phosphatase [Deltaproteobacteria bacterium]|nr:MAG: bifunctional alpha,alpha-trehalose-phosphate synthase (UDP-forming)/trehalose-phosphatase [Deltaproteobacteria bacterium]